MILRIRMITGYLEPLVLYDHEKMAASFENQGGHHWHAFFAGFSVFPHNFITNN